MADGLTPDAFNRLLDELESPAEVVDPLRDLIRVARRPETGTAPG